MSSVAYLSIESTSKGLISEGCNTISSMGNSYQSGHRDEITVLSYSHAVKYQNRSQHSPIQIVKKFDKSSPIIAQACSDGDVLTCTLNFYRPSTKSGLEKFYKISLTGAQIVSVASEMPHAIDFNQDEMQESVLISYRDIQWQHVLANTNGYSSWLNKLEDML